MTTKVNQNTSKYSTELIWQWVTRVFLIMIAIIGFFIANALDSIEKDSDAAASDRKEMSREINELKKNAAVTDERYIQIQNTLNEIKAKL
jgi:heme/copper-type cytochrome/quinol oxidase subunit 2